MNKMNIHVDPWNLKLGDMVSQIGDPTSLGLIIWKDLFGGSAQVEVYWTRIGGSDSYMRAPTTMWCMLTRLRPAIVRDEMNKLDKGQI